MAKPGAMDRGDHRQRDATGCAGGPLQPVFVLPVVCLALLACMAAPSEEVAARWFVAVVALGATAVSLVRGAVPPRRWDDRFDWPPNLIRRNGVCLTPPGRHRRLVRWIDLLSADELSPGLRRVRWRGGECKLNDDDTVEYNLVLAIRAALQARARGEHLPGDKEAIGDATDASLSRVAEPARLADERGLSLVAEDEAATAES